MRDSAHAGDQEQMTTVSQTEHMIGGTKPPSSKPRSDANTSGSLKDTNQETGIKLPSTSIDHPSNEPPHQEGSSLTAVPLSTSIQSRIGAQMQSFYNDLLKEETPERFIKLLEELDRKFPPR